MKKNILLISLFFVSYFFCLNSYSQITRGALPAELYISGDWYLDDYGQLHYGIFHSTNNGKNISPKYDNVGAPPNDEMSVGKVIGDATAGALYNYGNNELWVSFDYGESWEYRGASQGYTSFWGGQDNAFYKCGCGLLEKSIDYALTFEIVSDPPNCPISDIGIYDGEFYGIDGNAGEGFFLYYTDNYANTFTEIPIDNSVAFYAPSGQFPKISRGTEPGELYLASWDAELHYRIFHSVDTGYTWTKQYESDYIDIYYWSVLFTAGREPGSFYVLRARMNPAGDHMWLYIDYSSDYGETFTTYFHDLDSTITSINSVKPDNINLSNYPNPVKRETTFQFQLPKNCANPLLTIYDINGKKVAQLNICGKKSETWTGTNFNGNRVNKGLYLYNISYDGFTSKYNKLLIVD